MKNGQKKNRLEAVTSKRLSPEQNSENHCKNSISQPIEKARETFPPKGYAGTWTDPEQRFPSMPLYEMPEETVEQWNAKVARAARREELLQNWHAETQEEWTQEWRDELTAEEADLVDDWDSRYVMVMRRMCEEILKLEAEYAK